MTCNRFRHTIRLGVFCLALSLGAGASAEPGPQQRSPAGDRRPKPHSDDDKEPKPVPPPDKPKPLPPPGEKKPDPPDETPPKPDKALRCSLRDNQLPRGGRLEIEGQNFGKTPVVQIGGHTARILERSEKTLAVQVPRDSEGGMVTVRAGKQKAECGELTIIGLD